MRPQQGSIFLPRACSWASPVPAVSGGTERWLWEPSVSAWCYTPRLRQTGGISWRFSECLRELDKKDHSRKRSHSIYLSVYLKNTVSPPRFETEVLGTGDTEEDHRYIFNGRAPRVYFLGVSKAAAVQLRGQPGSAVGTVPERRFEWTCPPCKPNLTANRTLLV